MRRDISTRHTMLYAATLGFALACVAVATLASSALANPPGLRDAEVGKLLWKFNVIVKPNPWSSGGNACNGARIFFVDDGVGPLGTIRWLLDPAAAQDFKIVDCNGTDGEASVRVDEDQGNVIVAIRVLGPKTSQLNLVCDVITNPTETPGEELCVFDEINLDKSKNFTKVMRNIAEGEFEEVLWTLSGDWKIFDVRVYEWLLL